MGCTELANELCRVQTCVVCQDGRNLHESLCKTFHCHTFFSTNLVQLFLHSLGHGHLHGATAPNHTSFLHSLVKYCERIVERTLSLVEHVLRAASEHNGAGLSLCATRELDDLVFTNHDLFYLVTLAQLRLLRALESRDNVSTQDGSQAFTSIEVGVFDSHHSILLEELVWIIVNQLSVDENIAAMPDNLPNLCLHLLLLCSLNLGHCFEGVDLDFSPIDLDLVRVHLAVGYKHLAVLQSFLMTYCNSLLQDESL
mmetsp:Transcript_97728/g.174097  ORF Transcript_97728/g.174097 Transcript_97728/m.174097 type:complete len:255 (-) Transcript_97728:746-1510(-)